MVCTSQTFAQGFQSLHNFYQNQYDRKVQQQQNNMNEQVKQMVALQQNSFIRLDHKIDTISPHTQEEQASTQYVTQIYLPPEPPTFMDNVKSSLPNLLIKGLLLGL